MNLEQNKSRIGKGYKTPVQHVSFSQSAEHFIRELQSSNSNKLKKEGPDIEYYQNAMFKNNQLSEHIENWHKPFVLKIKGLLILFMSLICLSLTAQEKTTPKSSSKTGSIKGLVIDENIQQPVIYANIIIKSIGDKQIITGGITDDKGNFEVKKIPYGESILEVQFIGYKTVEKRISISKDSRNVNLGTIYIEQSAEGLEEIEIVAERSTIEQKIDRKVINVGKDLTTTGATAADIMVNIPSVNLDQDGNISLRGNQNVRVLVDGKPTNIDASQLLKQIPSTSIKTIELITNPSAKYNPEGMSGIINIILHRNSKIGFNGSINAGTTVGIETKFNSTLNLNYRTGKVNVFGNYGNNIGKTPFIGTIFRPVENSNQFFSTENDDISHLFKIGVDYYLNKKSTISIYTNQNIFETDVTSSTEIIYLDGNIPDLNQLLKGSNDNNSATYNLDFKHNFDKEGHNIEFEVDYNNYESEESSDFEFIGGGGLFSSYRDDLEDDRDITTINLDYVYPISDKTKLELGSEVRLRRTKNDYKTTNSNLRNSQFSYDNDIYSFYATYGKTLKKWSYQIGARLENYKVDAIFDQVGVPEDGFDDDIFSIYPSAFLKYTPGEEEKDSYQISFSRRVDRPGIGQINPIRVWSSPRITSIGNPKLIPQFTNSIELNYSRRLEKGSISFGTFFRTIEDEISRIGFVDPEDPTKIILSYDNYDDNTSFGFEVAFNYKLANWWSVGASFDLYSQTQKGIVEDEFLEVENVLYNFRISNSFKATKKLTFQVFALYTGPSENLQFEVGEFYFINAGARYGFADGKGTFSLNFNDIFKNQNWFFDGERPLKQIGKFTWDSRTVYFGLSYRFGQGKNKALRRKRRDKNEKSASPFL